MGEVRNFSLLLEKGNLCIATSCGSCCHTYDKRYCTRIKIWHKYGKTCKFKQSKLMYSLLKDLVLWWKNILTSYAYCTLPNFWIVIWGCHLETDLKRNGKTNLEKTFSKFISLCIFYMFSEDTQKVTVLRPKVLSVSCFTLTASPVFIWMSPSQLANSSCVSEIPLFSIATANIWIHPFNYLLSLDEIIQYFCLLISMNNMREN